MGISYTKHCGHNRNLMDKAITFLRYRETRPYICENDIILDIGCGPEALFLWQNHNLFLRGYGVDLNVDNMARSNISLFKGDAACLPFPDDMFDKVFYSAVLEHLWDPQRSINEAVRVLKPGGKIIMTTPTPRAKGLLEFLAFRFHIINADEISDHKAYYGREEIEYFIRNNGMTYLLKYKSFEFGMNSLIIISKP